MGSAFRVMDTFYFQGDFERMVVDGSCNGVDLVGAPYFRLRSTVEVRNLRMREGPYKLMRRQIAICVLDGIAFIAFSGLSWRLIQAS